MNNNQTNYYNVLNSSESDDESDLEDNSEDMSETSSEELGRQISKTSSEERKKICCKITNNPDCFTSKEAIEELLKIVKTIKFGNVKCRTLYNWDADSVHDKIQHIKVGSFLLTISEDSADHEGDYTFGYKFALKDSQQDYAMWAKSGTFFWKNDDKVESAFDDYYKYIPLTYNEEIIKKELGQYNNVKIEDYIEFIFLLAGGSSKYEKQKEYQIFY